MNHISASAPTKTSNAPEQIPSRHSSPPSSSAFGTQRWIEDDYPRADDDDDDAEITAISNHRGSTRRASSGELERFYEHREALQAEQDKANYPALASSSMRNPRSKFIERQPGAERIEFEFTLPSDDERNAQPGTQDQDMSEPSQDEGFQSNTRNALSNPRNNKHPAETIAVRRPRKRARISQNNGVGSGDIGDSIAIRTNDQNEEFVSTQIRDKSKKRARTLTAQKRVGKAAQTRKPWTAEEENALESLIAKYGISWAGLKNRDTEDYLVDRDQGALKDKARNLKFLYLKSSRPSLNARVIMLTFHLQDRRSLAYEFRFSPTKDKPNDSTLQRLRCPIIRGR